MPPFISAFFNFEKMISQQIILIIYYVVGALILLGGVVGGLTSMGGNFFMGLVQIFIGTPLALIFWRIWCELLILAFKMYDRLGEIRDGMNSSGPAA